MNEALFLIGHGSVRYPDAASAMHRHVGLLRRSKRFAQIEVGLLNGTPSVAEALTRINAPIIRVVPFFMEDGYFSRVAIPRALLGRDCVLCPPIGVHDAMPALMQRQALAACRDFNLAPEATAVVIIGHGSSSAPGRALALHRHAARLAATSKFARVQPACLEEAPFVADALAPLRTHKVIVIGFFANHGGHVRDDVPALIARERAARMDIGPADIGPAVWFAGCITDDAAMPQIILDQALNVVSPR